MKEKTKQAYMMVAKAVAQCCKSTHLKAGCVLIMDEIATTGFYEMPDGFDPCCEKKKYADGAGGWLSPDQIEDQWPYEDEHGRYNVELLDEAIHPEVIAIAKATKSGLSTKNGILFCTQTPCLDCAKMLYSCGIFEVYYHEESENTDGFAFLKKVGIQITQLK